MKASVAKSAASRLERRRAGRVLRWAPCLALLAVLGCGASAALTSKYETPGTVAGRSTFAFADAPGLTEEGYTTGHLFNPIMQRRVKDEVSKQLAAKGYQPGTPDSASMLISFTTGGREEVVTQGDQKGNVVRGPAYTVQRGALFLHFVDPQTQQVVWRGWAEGAIKLDDDLDAKVRQAVRQILAPFPAAHS